jgi:ABC-2 type transport system permease protein
MNAESVTMTQPNPGSATPATTRPFYWSVRRELWENRSLYFAPLIVAVVQVFGFAISAIGLAERRRALLLLDPSTQRLRVEQPYDIAAIMMIFTVFIVGFFYCLDALYGERRDRSILFWKSLPVSDLTVVLAKASIPIVVLQLVSFVTTVATQVVMLMLSTAVLRASGQSAGPLWTQLSIFRTWLLLLYHLITVHALWYAPVYAWLLFVSAWSRRAAFLWAILPPFALCGLEKIAFGTSRLAAQLEYRLTAGMEAFTAPGTLPTDPMNHATPGRFLTSPGLWIGLLVAAGFLAAAVRLRRSRGPL